MTIFGRPISQYTKNLNQIHNYLWYCVKCALMFQRPWSVLYHYFTKTVPTNKMVELRSGLKIFLSDHPDDIITVFLIFIREDYGKVSPGSIIIDIGANIGVFSLYAIHSGAKKVYAYEPNTQTYHCLLKNISANKLDNVIISNQLAVSSVSNGIIKFPVQPSAHNTIITDEESNEDFEIVHTTTLEDIIASNNIDQIHLLKVDCEGSEYDILLNTDGRTWDNIKGIKMEYHCGQTDTLITFLTGHHFTLTLLREDSDISGNMWFEKRASIPQISSLS